MSEYAALTIDVELFSQTPAYRAASGSTDRAGIGLDGLAFLKDSLEDANATTTCFVVSEIAETHPETVRSLSVAGHEIGSHTYTHRLLTDLEPGERYEELVRSKETLEATTGTTVEGFRAPAFDFGPDHFHALAAAGYGYDASVVASRTIPGFYGGEYRLQHPAPATHIDPTAPDSITAIPTSVMPGFRLPLTGFWLRLFGVRYTILGMKLLARRGIAPVLYVHPWEFVDLPDVEGVPRRVTFRTGVWMRRAVERILDQPFAFRSLRRILADADIRTGSMTPTDSEETDLDDRSTIPDSEAQ
ncbi:polysaccharide deacetylase family protein [Halorhabdus amylolytica]|uniref:polysaccharide deacetylase family protein n=1 Tax=Halorhabdus amylolytica TaxID=2559573 RepID=UPI0010AA5008|nr:polysaccharide deacetylase family protein [Halorhabdus amylolytica]